MNTKEARQLRYVRLLLEGFSPDQAQEMMRSKGGRRKKLLEKEVAGEESRAPEVLRNRVTPT